MRESKPYRGLPQRLTADIASYCDAHTRYGAGNLANADFKFRHPGSTRANPRTCRAEFFVAGDGGTMGVQCETQRGGREELDSRLTSAAGRYLAQQCELNQRSADWYEWGVYYAPYARSRNW